jgi:hypothetical protein
MASDDETKQLLQNLLVALYKNESSTTQVSEAPRQGQSYLTAGDGQFLGQIINSTTDRESLLNVYGPYGSEYSSTSIFNKYCPYGGAYGQWSPENTYCAKPPSLLVRGRLLGHITENSYITDRIPFKSFVYALRNNINQLLEGRISRSDEEMRASAGESFLVADDGVFLGRLTTNTFDQQSVFNTFGPHGSEFSQTSIYNNFCPYGGNFSPQSPFNNFSNTPPKIYVRGNFIGYLTTNNLKNPRLDPHDLKAWVQKHIGR